MSSIFSGIPSDKWIMNNELAFAILDIYPASKGHTLFIPKREIKTFFEINNDELINKRKDEILKEDDSVEGFNILINNGAIAGQTVFHLHFHLIPRRKNDSAQENFFSNLGKARS
ncbi:MAG TPA: HIT domain-containing protein [Dehalococcoidia bacterium]|nr:HIT domain-containing protein [Dehalococcoidia bacterium]